MYPSLIVHNGHLVYLTSPNQNSHQMFLLLNFIPQQLPPIPLFRKMKVSMRHSLCDLFGVTTYLLAFFLICT